MTRADSLVDPLNRRKPQRARAAGLVALAVIGTLLVPILAAPPVAADVGGTLDATYGAGDGIAERRARFRPDRITAVTVDSSDRVLTAATEAFEGVPARTYVTRYLPDGTVDASFANFGAMTLINGPEIERIIVRSDGTIMLAGVIGALDGDDFYVARLNSDGGFDESFNEGGRLVLGAGSLEDCNEFGCVTVHGRALVGDLAQRGDNLILGGSALFEIDCNFGGCTEIFEPRMWQITDAGTVDPGFIGQLVLDQIGLDAGCVDVAVDASDRIYCLENKVEMNVARLFAGGSADSSFSGDGVAAVNFSGFEAPRGLVLDNGRPLLVGEGNLLSSTVDDVVLARFTTAGNLDTTFSGDGRNRLSVVAGDDFVRSVRVDSSDRLLLAVSDSVGDNGVVARFTSAGSLDTSFDGDGKTPVAGSVIVTGIARNGTKVVAAGYNSSGKATLSRLTAAGALDSPFGGDGHAPTEVFALDSSFAGIALQPDGKAVTAGSASFPADDLATVSRFDTTGAVDTTFPEILEPLSNGARATGVAVAGEGIGVIQEETAGDGIYLARYDSVDPELNGFVALGQGQVAAVTAVGTDGFVVAGTSDGPLGDDILVARAVSAADLTLDTTFGTTGIVRTSISDGTDRAGAVAVQPDGKVVVVGSSFVSGEKRLLVMRFTQDGQLDPTFSDDGWVRLNFTGDDEGTAVALTADGGVIVAGTGVTPTEDRMLVARLTAAGVLDPAFGNGGKLNFRIGLARGSAVNAVAIDPQGRIDLAGSADAGGGGEVALVRFNANGTPDTALTGTGHFVLTSIGDGEDVGRGIAVQPDGRILIAGTGDTDAGTEAVIVAYTGVTTEVFVHTSGSAFEGDSGSAVHLLFLVGLDAASTGPVSVHWATANGTATAGVDYVAASGDITFNPGQILQGVQVEINGDLGAENHETIQLVLSAPTNARVGGANGLATITDDDLGPRPPTVKVTGPKAVSEAVGAAGVTYKVILSSASSLPVQVDAATLNGSAVAPGDYGPVGQTFAFAPGETMKSFVVPIADDVLDEANETFAVGLSNPQNTVIATPLVNTKINDDDAMPTVSISDRSMTEGDAGTSNMVFVVTLSAPSGRVIKVNFATSDITALAGSDYEAKSGTLTIAPLMGGGQFVVKITGDVAVEGPETLAVTLSNPVSVTILDGDGVGTIIDNE